MCDAVESSFWANVLFPHSLPLYIVILCFSAFISSDVLFIFYEYHSSTWLSVVINKHKSSQPCRRKIHKAPQDKILYVPCVKVKKPGTSWSMSSYLSWSLQTLQFEAAAHMLTNGSLTNQGCCLCKLIGWPSIICGSGLTFFYALALYSSLSQRWEALQ